MTENALTIVLLERNPSLQERPGLIQTHRCCGRESEKGRLNFRSAPDQAPEDAGELSDHRRAVRPGDHAGRSLESNGGHGQRRGLAGVVTVSMDAPDVCVVYWSADAAVHEAVVWDLSGGWQREHPRRVVVPLAEGVLLYD